MTPALGWILLVISGVTDVAWALATKRSNGFTDVLWSGISLVLLALFIGMLAKALEVLPLGTAYAVWTGIGAIGSLGVGILFLGEPAAATRLLFAVVTIVGIAGLKLTS